MWRLRIETESGERTEVLLRRALYDFGRAEGNLIRLTDQNVSRLHARVRRDGGSLVVEDLGSSNGTYLNGERVAGQVSLETGDLVQIGDYFLYFLKEETPDSPQEPLVRPPRLVMLEGPTPGAQFPLASRTVLGRGPEVDIDIDDTSVSRRHCEVVALGGGHFEVVDLASGNGVVLNRTRIERAILESGDMLTLGTVRFRFVPLGEHFVVPQQTRTLPDRRPRRPWRHGLPYAIFIAVVIVGAAFAWMWNRR